ncbi:hypothetical protein Moror_10718 [Moniliophthora roreri MCA 2997]|uniref:Uncharacterized protein n=1 Tax=Moniliophthora roreri (strain MCA 2997) TaxID=1381753 RepID=V2XD89_MONRO|nr:hypothetical protein Moror_10718 [Moniliophthora roreri MCA 2997]
MSFNNSSEVFITGENTFNDVHGNQVNQTISTGAIHIHGTATQTAKHTIYDEVNYVKLSQIISVKELGSVDLSKWDWMWTNGKLLRRRRKSAHRTIRTVKIYPDRQSKFTAITYEGEDAHEAWEEDLQRFLRVRGYCKVATRSGGLTRFKFIAQEEVSLTAVFDDSAELWKGWLSQSPHVFATFETVACQGSFFADEFVDSVDHCDTDSDEDSVGFCDEKEETAPIYLFLYPPPMTILELIPWMGGRTHFWSLDETGQSKMSKEECEQRGLPSLFAATLYSRGSVELYSWPAHIYVALRD